MNNLKAFEDLFNEIKDVFLTFFGYVNDYWSDFLKDPSVFVEKHTFVFLAVIFILILVIVLIINLCRSISDRREIKKKKLEDLIAELKDENLSTKDSVSSDRVEEKTELVQLIETVEETKEELPLEETDLKESIDEVPLPTVVRAPEEKEIPMEKPISHDSEKEQIEGSNKKDIPEYEFVAEVRFIQPRKKEEEILPDVHVEVPTPTLYRDRESIIEKKSERELNLPFEDEELNLEFENSERDGELKAGNAPLFDPIPELKTLERDNINSFDEIIYEEEEVKEEKHEPIVMEKIEVIKVNPAQKFGVKNRDTNRLGKTFTYNEIDKLIKD